MDQGADLKFDKSSLMHLNCQLIMTILHLVPLIMKLVERFSFEISSLSWAGPWQLVRNLDTSFSLCHRLTNWNRFTNVVSILLHVYRAVGIYNLLILPKTFPTSLYKSWFSPSKPKCKLGLDASCSLIQLDPPSYQNAGRAGHTHGSW